MRYVYFLIFLLMISGVFAQVDSSIGDIRTNKDYDLNVDKYRYVALSGDSIQTGSVPQPSLFDYISMIFGGSGSYSFIDEGVSTESIDRLCTLTSWHGEYGKSAYYDGHTGQQCDNGEFIAWTQTRVDGVPDYMFADFWYKSDSDDIIYWKDDASYFYDKSITYFYMCYECDIEVIDPNERGCLTRDKTECVTFSDRDCYYEQYKYEEVCEQNIVKPSYCGDGTCDSDETQSSCPKDCGTPPPNIFCGDDICSSGETYTSCPKDCEKPTSCGDGKCEGTENIATCPEDCDLTPDCTEGQIKCLSGNVNECVDGSFIVKQECSNVCQNTPNGAECFSDNGIIEWWNGLSTTNKVLIGVLTALVLGMLILFAVNKGGKGKGGL